MAASRKAYNAAYYKKHAVEQAAQARQRRAAFPDWERDKKFRRAYGITFAQAAEMWVAQGCRCPICREPMEFPSKVTHVDHCHRSQKVRGLLCTRCNTGLGQFEDNILLLRRAIAYLRRHYVE